MVITCSRFDPHNRTRMLNICVQRSCVERESNPPAHADIANVGQTAWTEAYQVRIVRPCRVFLYHGLLKNLP